jgi:hypothetical protein
MPGADVFLVEADLLQARGDPLGELIVVEHALVERPGDRALVQRQRKLLGEYALLGRVDEGAWFGLVMSARRAFTAPAGHAHRIGVRYQRMFRARYDLERVEPRRWQPRLMGVPAVKGLRLWHAFWELAEVHEDTVLWRGVFDIDGVHDHSELVARLDAELHVGWPAVMLVDGTAAEATELEALDAEVWTVDPARAVATPW